MQHGIPAKGKIEATYTVKKADGESSVLYKVGEKDKELARVDFVYQAPSILKSMPQVVMIRDTKQLQVVVLKKGQVVNHPEAGKPLWTYVDNSLLAKLKRKWLK